MRKGYSLQNREQGMNYALRLLNQRQYSEFTLAQKLRGRGLSEEDIGFILIRLRDLKLINDERYAESIIRDMATFRRMSQQSIKQRLRQKGVADATISQELRRQSDLPDEQERAMYHAKRYCAQHRGKVSDPAFSNRLAGYLYRKGFSTAIIYTITHDETLFDNSSD